MASSRHIETSHQEMVKPDVRISLFVLYRALAMIERPQIIRVTICKDKLLPEFIGAGIQYHPTHTKLHAKPRDDDHHALLHESIRLNYRYSITKQLTAAACGPWLVITRHRSLGSTVLYENTSELIMPSPQSHYTCTKRCLNHWEFRLPRSVFNFETGGGHCWFWNNPLKWYWSSCKGFACLFTRRF